MLPFGVEVDPHRYETITYVFIEGPMNACTI
jgi:hypothetical protein